MSELTGDGPSRPPENYAFGEERAFTQLLQRRGLMDGGHFLSRLRPGLRLLDVGCGPGQVTVVLAELVAPGEVVGLDHDAQMVDRGNVLAAERSIPNVRFENGDAYKLPFEDASFDVAYAQMVMMHLPDVVVALKELRRVVKPGGFACIADADVGTRILEPPPAELSLLEEMEGRFYALTGRDVYFGRKQRRLLLEAGFDRAEQTCVTNALGTDERLATLGAAIDGVVGTIARTAVEQGWLDRSQADEMMTGLREWTRRPDAFYATSTFVAFGFVDQ